MRESCWAGRKAFLGGHPDWVLPCGRSMEPTHIITDPETPNAMWIKLCSFHYRQAEESGLVADPNPSPERVRRWEQGS